jgi:hypothetical protein
MPSRGTSAYLEGASVLYFLLAVVPVRNCEGLQPYGRSSVLRLRPDSKVVSCVRARSSPSKDRMQIVHPVPPAVRRRGF